MKHLTDRELLKQTENLAQQERELLTEVLAHFREISDRKLFSELGYKSLFEFAVKHLGYSEAQAYRRINAMKLVRQLPGLEEKIQSGQINLSHVGIAQNLFQQEARAENPYSLEQKQEILNKIAGTSSREAEKITQQLSSNPETLRPEKAKPISDSFVALQITVSNSTMKQVDTLKGWLAHKYPGMSTSDLLEKLCELGLKEWDPAKPKARSTRQVKSFEAPSHQQFPEEEKPASKAKDACDSSTFEKTKTPTSPPLEAAIQAASIKPEKTSRGISASIRRLVFARSHNQCEKCQSVYFLEIDHRIPVALGGTNDLENLRLLCSNCNQRAAINAFGKGKNLVAEQSYGSCKVVELTGPVKVKLPA